MGEEEDARKNKEFRREGKSPQRLLVNPETAQTV